MGKKKNRCDALLMALGQATRACCDLAAENKQLKAKAASHGECLKGLHDSHNQEHDELVAEYAKLEQECNVLKERVSHLQEDYAKLTQEHNGLKERVAWDTNSNKRCV